LYVGATLICIAVIAKNAFNYLFYDEKFASLFYDTKIQFQNH